MECRALVTRAPAYDAAGNMISGPKPGDEGDEDVPDGTELELTYDAWNRLVKVEVDSTTVAEYQYDGLNRQIARSRTAVRQEECEMGRLK